MNGKIYKYFNKKKYEKEGIKKYYIGQTVKTIEQRAGKNGSRYIKNTNTKFANDINKWGWDAFECEILEEGIHTQDELNSAEIRYINEYDSFNNGYNTTLGGEGSSGYHISEDRKQKMLNGKRRKVYCPELDMTFDSIREAAKYIGLKSENGIAKVCAGKRLFSGVYNINGQNVKLTWIYVTDKVNNIKHAKNIYITEDSFKEDLKLKISNSSTLKRKVYCPELDMTFDSIREAAKYANISTPANISKVCNGKRNYAGIFIINGIETKLTWIYID